MPAVHLLGDVLGVSGYDTLVAATLKGLRAAGVDAVLHPRCRVDPEVLPPEKAPRGEADWAVLVVPPLAARGWPVTPRTVVVTMWESDALDPDWVAALAPAAAVAVPTVWGADVFRAAGVRPPVHVLPLGHEPLVYHPRSGTGPAAPTFGVALATAGGGYRKNLGTVVAAFRLAFPPGHPARLRVKVTPRCHVADPPDDRVEVLRAALPPARLADWYRANTALVSASAGEGWGLHQVESMACGRPLVAPAYSATAAYLDETVGYVVPHAVVPATGHYAGRWAAVDPADLARVLAAVAANPVEAGYRGAAAARRARPYTWARYAAGLAALLRGCGAPVP